MKAPAQLRFSVKEKKKFKTMTLFLIEHKSKMAGGCCDLKFLRLNGRRLMRFQSEISVYKFLRSGECRGGAFQYGSKREM